MKYAVAFSSSHRARIIVFPLVLALFLWSHTAVAGDSLFGSLMNGVVGVLYEVAHNAYIHELVPDSFPFYAKLNIMNQARCKALILVSFTDHHSVDPEKIAEELDGFPKKIAAQLKDGDTLPYRLNQEEIDTLFDVFPKIAAAQLEDEVSPLSVAYESRRPDILRVFTERDIFRVENTRYNYVFDLRHKMREALDRNDREEINFLHDSGVFDDPQGNTPLHYAVEGREIDRIKELLRHRADPSHQNSEGVSPLRMAVEQGDFEIVSIFHKDAFGCTITDEFVQDIYDALADKEIIDQRRVDMLVRFLKCNEQSIEEDPSHAFISYECIAEHFENLCNIALKYLNRDLTWYLIWWAYRNKHFGGIRKFCDQNIDLTTYTNDEGLTIVHDAVKTGHYDDDELCQLIELMMDQEQCSTILFIQDSYGKLPLEYDKSCETFFRVWNLFVSLMNQEWYSVLERAFSEHKEEFFKTIVKKGYSDFLSDKKGKTLLLHAFESGTYQEKVPFVIEISGIKRDAFIEHIKIFFLKDEKGKNLFQKLLVDKGVEEVSKLFLWLEELVRSQESRIRRENSIFFFKLVRQQTREGKNLLHAAAARGSADFIQKIVTYGNTNNCGQDITTIRDHYGRLPIWYARKAKNTQALDFFYEHKRQHSADVLDQSDEKKLNREERHHYLISLLEEQEAMKCSGKVVERLAQVTQRMDKEDLKALIKRAYRVAQEEQGRSGGWHQNSDENDLQRRYRELYRIIEEHGDIERAVVICSELLEKAGNFVADHSSSGDQHEGAEQVQARTQSKIEKINRAQFWLGKLKSVSHMFGKGIAGLGKLLGFAHEHDPHWVHEKTRHLLLEVDKHIRSLLELEEEDLLHYRNRECSPVVSDKHLQEAFDRLKQVIQGHMDPLKSTIIIVYVDLLSQNNDHNQSLIEFDKIPLDSRQRRKIKNTMTFLPKHLKAPWGCFRHVLLHGACNDDAKFIADALCDKYHYNFMKPSFEELSTLKFDTIRETLAPCIIFIEDFEEILKRPDLALYFREQVQLKIKHEVYGENLIIVVAGISNMHNLPEVLKKSYDSFMTYFHVIDIQPPHEIEREDIVSRWMKKHHPSLCNEVSVKHYAQETEGYSRSQICDYLLDMYDGFSDDSDDIC